jgi:hypothetical protein
MFDNESVNEFELGCLERQLSNIALSPPRRQRERLLYACGRAVGRAEMRRRVRAATAAAAIVAVTSTALCLVVVTERAPTSTVVVRSTAASPAWDSAVPPASVVQRPPDPPSDGRGRQLTASTRVTELMSWDTEGAVASHHTGESIPGPKPMLTVAGALISGRFND